MRPCTLGKEQVSLLQCVFNRLITLFIVLVLSRANQYTFLWNGWIHSAFLAEFNVRPLFLDFQFKWILLKLLKNIALEDYLKSTTQHWSTFPNSFLNRVESRMHWELTETCSLIGIFILCFSLPFFLCLSWMVVANAPLPSWWASQQFPLEAASLYLPGSLSSRWWRAVELIHCISQKPGSFWYLCSTHRLAWFETVNSLYASQTRFPCLLLCMSV